MDSKTSFTSCTIYILYDIKFIKQIFKHVLVLGCHRSGSVGLRINLPTNPISSCLASANQKGWGYQPKCSVGVDSWITVPSISLIKDVKGGDEVEIEQVRGKDQLDLLRVTSIG